MLQMLKECMTMIPLQTIPNFIIHSFYNMILCIMRLEKPRGEWDISHVQWKKKIKRKE